jgi:hypothetical protein
MVVLSFATNRALAASSLTGGITKEAKGKWTLGQHFRIPITTATGTNAEVRTCTLNKERCEIVRNISGRAETNVQMRIFLTTEDQPSEEIWSLWVDQFPPSYDFVVGGTDTVAALVFARGCTLALVDKFQRTSEGSAILAHLKHEDEGVSYVNLCDLFGRDAFEGGYDAQKLDLSVSSVLFDKTWHVVIRGHDGKKYRIARAGVEWIHDDPK